jgi:catechol 2,3-dioxygenase-like lactoylglutathione lyase family enzyme
MTGLFAVARERGSTMNLSDLSVSHYDIHCDDLEKARRFYTEVLGFECLFATPPDDEAPISLIWLKNAAGVVVELTKEKSDYAAEATNRASLAHLALRSTNLDAAVSWLKQNAVSFELEPTEIMLPTGSGDPDPGMKMRVAFFRGPSGERFEILEDVAD